MVSRFRDIIVSSILPLFFFLFFDSFPSTLASSETAATHLPGLREELEKLKTRMEKINRTAITTIQSPDGDILDCVLSHQQPAFDHPLLKGKKPMEPSERPRGHRTGSVTEDFHLWAGRGEACPEGTIPIRRTTEADIMRSSDATMFGRKARRIITRDTSSYGHEHAVALAAGGQFYGAKASINVWSPSVTSSGEFSLSQIWVTSGSFGTDLNTIEAGWQVSPELYGDNLPRFFTYWTSDAYQETGCYNLLCSGFVQTNRRIAMGAAISPFSSYRGGQFDISLLIWKDPKHGNWWLEFGSGILVGYWPALLFSRLKDGGATMVQFGGEVVNKAVAGSHTSTQMGSGHFAGEGFRKAAYFRNMQVVDWGNSLIPIPNLKFVADHPHCYDVAGGNNAAWGTYFFYGGPGRNVRCP